MNNGERILLQVFIICCSIGIGCTLGAISVKQEEENDTTPIELSVRTCPELSSGGIVTRTPAYNQIDIKYKTKLFTFTNDSFPQDEVNMFIEETMVEPINLTKSDYGLWLLYKEDK